MQAPTSKPAEFSLPNRLKPLLRPFLNMTLYPLSRLAPRSRKAWAFGHIHDTFSGNQKYLFLWMVLHRPDIRVTWITGKEQTYRMLRAASYPVRKRWSLEGMVAALRSKVFVSGHGLQHVNLQLSRGALYLNLWHGVGLKATQFGDANSTVSLAHQEAAKSVLRKFALLEFLSTPDFLVTTSDMMQRHFEDQFRLPPGRLPQLGYPRLDCAYDEALRTAAENIDASEGFQMNPEGFSEIYIYMPTFRDSERPFLDQALPDLRQLSNALAARNALFYVKPHPRTADALPQEYRNIRVWPEEIDVYTYLSEFSGLITDYSSVLYDYLFLKPTGAILYTFDFEEYLSEDRQLLYPFEENVAGLRVSTFTELCEALREGKALEGHSPSQVEKIRQRFWGGSSAPASPAIVDFVERQLRR